MQVQTLGPDSSGCKCWSSHFLPSDWRDLLISLNLNFLIEKKFIYIYIYTHTHTHIYIYLPWRVIARLTWNNWCKAWAFQSLGNRECSHCPCLIIGRQREPLIWASPEVWRVLPVQPASYLWRRCRWSLSWPRPSCRRSQCRAVPSSWTHPCRLRWSWPGSAGRSVHAASHCQQEQSWSPGPGPGTHLSLLHHSHTWSPKVPGRGPFSDGTDE